jgi:hypothetical protein
VALARICQSTPSFSSFPRVVSTSFASMAISFGFRSISEITRATWASRALVSVTTR